MLIDRKTSQYHYDINSSWLDLEIQYYLNQNPEKLILKLIWKGRRSKIANMILKDKIWYYQIPRQYKATVIQTINVVTDERTSEETCGTE